MLRLTLLALVLLVGSTLAAPHTAQETRRLIQLGETERKWMTEQEILDLITATKAEKDLGVGFVDVTDHQTPSRAKMTKRAFPTQPTQQAVVRSLVTHMSAVGMTSFLDAFSNNFLNRYYQSTTGVQALEWLRDHMQEIADNAGRNDTVCELFKHTWAQPSVICKIQGVGANADEVVVCSAHADSINSLSPMNGLAPGADDDGSGVANFVEVFRAMIEGNFRPQRSIHFMGYAAEEVGLRGSQAIVQSYVLEGINVYGVYHNEMSGYPGRARSITVLRDYTDSQLTNFLISLVPVYTSLPSQTAVCGYGCSDHASWTSAGYSAICTAEAGPSGEVNPNMHRATDTLDNLDMEYSLEFAKLALGMVVELTEFAG